MTISLLYGHQQTFQRRCGDINILGRTELPLPIRRAKFRLNGSQGQPFYVESVASDGIDWSYEYKKSPARLRLPEPGDFNIEIAVASPHLRRGPNTLAIEVIGSDATRAAAECEFTWDPQPPSLPLDLRDLSVYRTIQDLGQVVDGAFELDKIAGVVRSRAPASPDSLLVLGPAAGSQQATYKFRFFDASRSKYVGLSDYFLAHLPEDPRLPLKPLWATVGLATIRPRGEYAWEARAWISPGDAPGWRPSDGQERPRVYRTDPPVYCPMEPRRWYRAKHALVLGDGHVRTRFRVWPVGDPEPPDWTCEAAAPDGLWDGPIRASFSLFQHSGFPSEWADIQVAAPDDV